MYHNLIKRTSEPTYRTSPWEGITFVYGVDSDDLADALKTAYPQYQTLNKRKYAAIIGFFQQELDRMRLDDTTPVSVKTPSFSVEPGMSPTAPNTPMNTDDGNHSVALSHSPAKSIVPQESSNRDPAAHGLLPRSFSADPTVGTSSNQFVFNALDGRMMRPNTKRKMTHEERLEYRETR
ncbi:hypothetical protein EJ07DRAFT_153509 [Lizonia empirigonia]|nr:hypothetical protein EJ07DRAFT_153509 [Lizonia empirigonia]